MSDQQNFKAFDILNKNKTGDGILTLSAGKEYTLKISGFAPVPAMILYPAMLTPELIFGTGPQTFELLIACRPADIISPEVVNNQLKIEKGIDSQKIVSTDPLFPVGNESSHITISKIASGISAQLSTSSKIKGYLDKRVIEALQSAKLTSLYSISISDYLFDTSGITHELFNCIWADTTASSGKIEAHDRIVDSVLGEFNGSGLPLKGKYAFKVGVNDIDFTQVDTSNPLQSYHPVIVYPDDSKCCNIGLVGDIHCSARQNILAKSKARVIDYDTTTSQYFPPGSINKTPTATKTKVTSIPQPAVATIQSYDIYIIKSGDWLSKIAPEYDMTWKELWNYDGGTSIPNSKRLKSGDPDLIYPGEEIVVPSSSTPITPTSSIDVSHDLLMYSMYAGADEPPELTIDVFAVGNSTVLDFSVNPDKPWIHIDPSSLFGTTTKTISIKVTATGMAPGTYDGTISIICSDASNSPLTIHVSFTIQDTAIKDDSPELGSIIAVASQNFKAILDKLGKDDEIDVVVIAGDIIDYIQNCFLDSAVDYSTPKKVWDHVQITDSNKKNRYHAFVDHVACFSLFTEFYKNYQKPLFIVSGNHDPYERPWGISPRATVFNVRANEGIPADCNLTFYEAILLFGETYHENPGLGNLVPRYFKWFFNLYTPFCDYIIDMPKQTLIGLCWGDDEDILDIPQGQGKGHLPRAEESFTDQQVQLLENAITMGKKVILTSHFTFASYHETIPLSTGVSTQGQIEYQEIGSTIGGINYYMMGTFECNREKIIKEHLHDKRDIALILTGHMHRRGCYQITGINASEEYVTTQFYDFDSFSSLATKTSPVIVVCDSGGNLPRYNKIGEFTQWGSDRASGVKILMDASGNVNSISTVPVGPKPRFVVALDYEDLIVSNKDVITKFETDTFLIADENNNTVDYSFSLEMRSDIVNLAYVDSITLYCYASDNTWKQLILKFNNSKSRWILQRGADAQIFKTYFVPNSSRSNFISIKFSLRSQDIAQYDFSTAWNFEFQIDEDTSGGGIFGSATHKKYIIERDKDYAEIPDFDWRKSLMKYTDTFGT
jgi:LysM repeat protein